MIEIEMKAWVTEEAALRARLQDHCRFVRSFVKEDSYWHIPDEHERRFRLRIDAGRTICTLKQKRLKSGLEINREIEFSISDATAFREFIAMLGYRAETSKHKAGEQYDCDGLTVELVRIDGLGLFLEVEQVLTNPTEGECQVAEQAVRNFFARMQLPAEAIEPRRYVDMLAAASSQRR